MKRVRKVAYFTIVQTDLFLSLFILFSDFDCTRAQKAHNSAIEQGYNKCHHSPYMIQHQIVVLIIIKWWTASSKRQTFFLEIYVLVGKFIRIIVICIKCV